MPEALVKVEAQSDYNGVGKTVPINIALMQLTADFTYATNGIQLDLTDIHADLVAADVHDIKLYPQGSVAESGVETYIGQWIRSTGKLLFKQVADVTVRDAAGTGTDTATRVQEVANSTSITTNFDLVVFYVKPGTNA